MDRLKHLSRIDDGTGCWTWVGTHDKGVPIIRLSHPRRLTSARRYAYEQAHQITLPRSRHVVATCGNRSCVNPEHLGVGQRPDEITGTCKHGHPRTIENTYVSKVGKPQCRVCHALWQRKDARRPEVRGKVRARVEAFRAEQYAFVDAMKAYRGCARCGEKDPQRLHCHHRDPELKEISISQAVVGWSRDRLIEELAKCEVLCAGCHVRRHAEMRKLHAADRVV